ncbi:hypothetical protein RJ55_08308 [Drechmeria coniospora]|nr:hypothetical protein RJ55_08308 [Drechmeria coniospora]
MSESLHNARSRGGRSRYAAQVQSRRTNDGAIIENPLDAELDGDVRQFAQQHLPCVSYEDILRAARVAKDIRLYDMIARRPGFDVRNRLPVHLTDEEKKALRRERDVTFSEKGMRIVIVTVSLAALLQGEHRPRLGYEKAASSDQSIHSLGFVQSSFNGASLYTTQWGLGPSGDGEESHGDDWRLGAANASPWFFAALVGCPLSLPVNYWFGRRGGISVAASLIIVSSIAAIFVENWQQLFCVRIVNGIGMGIKAVSTPILASETAVGFWRGSAILAWQLWVAFGIMMGFAFNIIFTNAPTERLTFALIQGAPLVPALALLIIVLWYCPESPRYHLMKGPNYSVEKAYRILQQVRTTKLQALRDMYVVFKALEQEHVGIGDLDDHALLSPGFIWVIRDFFAQFRQLFQQRRLYNATISTSTVNLAQQLCGVNVCAFYSGTLFNRVGAGSNVIAMAYSVGFGAINFLFALPAIKSIDVLGRRKWLNITLPFMALFMLGAALCAFIPDQEKRIGFTALFLFRTSSMPIRVDGALIKTVFAMAYSPGLGPIPFTLASESFPLSHREAGAAFAISINFFAAGLLSIFFPRINSKLGGAGSLGLFSGLNIVALVLVFLLVEETKRRNLEELDHIFAVSKREFMRFQVSRRLPWLIRRYLCGRRETRPELYRDLTWGSWDEGEEAPRELDGVDSFMAGRHSSAAEGSLPELKLSRTGTGDNVVVRADHPSVVEIGDGRPLQPPPLQQSPLGSHPNGFMFATSDFLNRPPRR